MHPELFDIPFINLTLRSFGLMMVISFLAGVSLVKHLSRNITPNPQFITNIALYSLISGVAGARLFYVVHYFDNFKDDLPSVFAIWQGGLEFYGGVIFAIPVIVFCLRHHKLPIRRYFDILAIALMMGLTFGRIGCFLNGCCFGKPTELPWAIRFPYNSFACLSQINSNLERNRPAAQLKLPKEEYLSFYGKNGKWYPKSIEELTAEQKIEVTKGKHRCLAVHPTQLYSSASAALCCLILYLFWRRAQKTSTSNKPGRPFTKPGYTVSLAFILYGITRFFLESLRDDNPFEFYSLTISQIIGIALIPLGVLLMVIFQRIKSNAFGS